MTTTRLATVFLALVGLASADTLTMKNGTTHNGTLVSATATTITFREEGRIHRYPRSSVDSLQFGASEAAGLSSRNSEPRTNSEAVEPGASRRVTLPAGTEIAVMTNDRIDSKTANTGQTFSADVAENVTDASGNIVVPKGSDAELVLRSVSSGGAIKGSELALDLQSVKVRGRRYTVNTKEIEKSASGLGANKRTATMVGGGAVLGTLIGAIAGGGKGAAIGAAAGAATGAGAQILTRGKSVEVPPETTLRFKLDQPLVLQAAY